MKISEHADHTEKLYGLRAEDIHKWIDGYFDREGFDQFLRYGYPRYADSGRGNADREQEENLSRFDPYDHRRYRHCREALPDAVREFSELYTEEQIRQVFECHIRDDYHNYIPTREDFTNGRFSEKYHESDADGEKILTTGELAKYFKGRHYHHAKRRERRSSWFRVRIVIPAAVALILFIGAILLIILPQFHQSLMTEKREMIREHTSIAVSILDYYISLELNGEISLQDAQEAAIDEIQKLRYGDDHSNYFWITDMHPTMIMHPWLPELNGMDLTSYTDSLNKSGKHLFVESVRLVEAEGGGFLEYLWQMSEESSLIVPKLSYVQGVEPWGWIIGTGVYIQDVEAEISRLNRTLVYVLVGIALLMGFLLVYLIFQSREIERSRKQAEIGLIEAKERYRALVESSNEGYLMRIGKQQVFCNSTFSRMTGYSEEEILAMPFWELLFPDTISTSELSKHIFNLQTEHPESDEFETQITCRGGNRLDVIVRVSRIFLSEENGEIISFRPITGVPFTESLFLDAQTESSRILIEIAESGNPAHVVRLMNQLPATVRSSLLSRKENPSNIRSYISQVYSDSLKKLIELTLPEYGEPPVPFAFISLGSSGREEMTLFSDQDNALIFADPDDSQDRERIRRWFLKLADSICRRINQGGFSFCPGGIMAMNPAYCLSLSEWKYHYSSWIRNADPQSLLDIHVFFDITTGWGEEALVGELKKEINDLINAKPIFLTYFARNCLQYRAPLGILGSLKAEERDGAGVVNIKEGLIPIINFARMYALREGVTESSTLKRLLIMKQRKIIPESTYHNLVDAFEILWEFRFTNQILLHGELRRVNDDLLLKGLNDANRKKLQKALSTIPDVQQRLSFDFLGLDLS